MQRNHLDKWAKAGRAACSSAVKSLLLGAAVLVAGCADLGDEGGDPDEFDLHDGALERLEIDELQPNTIVDIGPDDIAGQYIVQMKKGANPRATAAAVKATPRHVYGDVLNGFAGPLDTGQLRALSRHPNVLSIEPDQLVSTDAVQFMDGGGDPWYLDRIDQVNRPLDKRYNYNVTGRGVFVYVFDTGIKLDHPDFYDARAAFDAFGGNGQDCHGHGTHVAGIIGGKVHGVAKQASLRSVRVVGCNGTGSWSTVLAGIEWVRKNHVKPAVVNLSVSGPKSTTVNKALDELAKIGVFVAVSAGNQSSNACDYSPASAASVFATAASDRNDKRASYSNYGSCVSAYAPGSSIRSTWVDGGTRRLSGTSMASPQIAGAAALYKAAFGNVSTSRIKSDLRAWASRNKISSNPSKTPNLLLNVSRI